MVSRRVSQSRRLLAKVSVPDWQAGDLCTIPGRSRDDYRAHIFLTETGDFARGVRDIVKPFTEMVSCLFILSGPADVHRNFQYP